MSKSLTKANVDKMVKHDCATHVVHEKWGNGECIPEMHTIVETSDGEGYVTHYDVWFEHGIEVNVPVEALTIIESCSHGHAPKKKMSEALIGNQKKIDANKNNKIDAQDFKILKAKKKMMESLKVNMSQDSIDKEVSMSPSASKEKFKLPPSQGNKPVGGDQPSARVGGKYGVEESIENDEQFLIDEESLNNLYDALSEENQKIFMDKIETEEGLLEMLDFARSRGY